MKSSTLSAAEASARPMSESRTQLPARRPVDGGRGATMATLRATLQPQRAGTLPAPIGQRHRVFWALAVRCALRIPAWKRAACLFLGSTPSRRSPSMRSSCYMHGGFYTALLVASLRQMRRGLAGAKEGTASSSALTASPLARAPRALGATTPSPRTTPGA